MGDVCIDDVIEIFKLIDNPPKQKVKKTMKITNVKQIHDFLKVVDDCVDDVILSSQQGDVFNLKSQLSQYIAIGALLGEHGDELELFCGNSIDEAKFMTFFEKHPEV